MFDKDSATELMSLLPDNTKRLIKYLSQREPWLNHIAVDTESLTLIDEIGKILKSHDKITLLEKLSSDELSTLFIALSIERYLSALSVLGNFSHHSKLLQKIHNDINSAGVNQAALIMRLRTLVRFEVIARMFSPERLSQISNLLKEN